MSLIPLAAHLIRLAATDAEYAQDLADAVFADPRAHDELVGGPVQEADLAELTATEWQWYASWRQEWGGGLDQVVLDHLTDSASTPFARFEVRELVLRDRETNEGAIFAGYIPDESDDLIGLAWLRQQARRAETEDEALELMDDALQCATDASWFLLRLLTSRQHFRGELVSNELRDFAGERDIEPWILELWGLREPPDGN